MIPFFKTPEEFGQYVRLHFAKQDIPECSAENGVTVIKVIRAALTRVLQFLRDDPACRFAQLTDICSTHYPERTDGYLLAYHLLSLTTGRRLRVTCATSADVAVDSVSPVFQNAVWYEREIREMFGVSFENHPDLRRLLTDDGDRAFPLRKSEEQTVPPERLTGVDISEGGDD